MQSSEAVGSMSYSAFSLELGSNVGGLKWLSRAPYSPWGKPLRKGV